MFSFFKKAPKWANVLSYNDYTFIITDVEKYLKQRNISFELSKEGILQIEDLGYDLKELIIKCDQWSKDNWKELIEDYMLSIFDKHSFNSVFINDTGNFKNIESYLDVKLLTSKIINIIGRDSIYIRKVFVDFEKVLVFRFHDGSYQTIPEDIVNSWGKTSEELFNIALKNYFKIPLTLDKQCINSICINVFTRYDSANLLLDTPRINEFHGKEGFLFIVPNQHISCFYSINDVDVNKALNVLAQVIMEQITNKESSVLDENIYWYTKEGEVFQIPFMFSREKKIEIQCPQEYFDMMERISK